MAATVLVVDDDISVRAQLVQLLDENDYQTLVASYVQEAWEILVSEQVDILIYELSLSSSEGLSLLERIKREIPSLPVLVISATDNIVEVIRALRAGADDFLLQPLAAPVVFLHALQKTLERSFLAQENLAYRSHLEQSNAELRKRLLELRNDHLAGRELQMRMLPKPLLLDHIACDHKILPALFLSGDFLDYFKISEHQFAFYLADVSGHGASSAFVTVILKKLIEHLRRSYNKGLSAEILHPEQVLAFVNNDVFTSQLDKYLTIFYGVIDTRALTLRYSVGGHLPMPVIYAQGQSLYLEGRGMPVGLFADARYNSYHYQLPDEFRLLLFSDGVLELFKDLSMAEKESYLLSLVCQYQGDLKALVAGLHIDEQQEIVDDITMLVVARGAL